MSESSYVSIKDARINNLKNIDVDIPRNKLVVIIGLPGSGKSSPTLDTLCTKKQRCYMGSLNSYAHQFLGRMSEPEYDFIKRIPPAIAVERKVNSHNPRSIAGTSAEVYEYLRLLYSQVGRTCSPINRQEVKKYFTEDIIDCMFSCPGGIRYAVLTPIRLRKDRISQQQPEIDLKQGFNRVEVNGEMRYIGEHAPVADNEAYLLVNHMVVTNSKDAINRLTDSAETAMHEGDGTYILRFYPSDGTIKLHTLSTKFEAGGIVFEEPNGQVLSFNSSIGTCPICEGFSKAVDIDGYLVVPDRSLSVYEGVIVYWRGEEMGKWKEELVHSAEKFDFPTFTSYYRLTDTRRHLPWEDNRYSHSIDDFFEILKENQYKIQYRVMLARYHGKTLCPKYRDTRPRPKAGYVRVGGKNISELVNLPITELREFFDCLELGERDSDVSRRILVETNNRIRLLIGVDSGYLTLNRLNNSLPGGGSQRISLVASLGSSLVDNFYILDEPNIRLHSRDTDRLLHALRQLQRLDSAIVVVEYDEEVIRTADYIIDIGPNAGHLGGKVVYQSDMKDLKKGSSNYAVRYLLGEDEVPVPGHRRPWNNCIELKGAHKNNLKGTNVRISLNVMTVVASIFGSGKGTLVEDIFFRALERELDECSDRLGELSSVGRSLHDLRNVESVDQDPIGKSSRSSPAIYAKAYDKICKLWSKQPLAKQMGYTPGFFSLNSKGGRYKECKGEGTITVEMQLMVDLVLECGSCRGKRFRSDTLEMKLSDKSIYGMLKITVNQVVELFNEHGQKKVVKKLLPSQDAGLECIKLRQSPSAPSGDENQRVKLTSYLSQEKADLAMSTFNELITEPHFHDIRKLLGAFDALIRRGHSVAIIEHNMNIIKCVDYVIDLRSEGGDKGGNIAAAGAPEEVTTCETSYTGQFLKEKLGQSNRLSEICYISAHM